MGVILFVVDIICGITPVGEVSLKDGISTSFDGEITLLKAILSDDGSFLTIGDTGIVVKLDSI